MKAEITKETTLAKILKLPSAEKVLAKYDVPCLGCAFAKMEMESLKIGQICKNYNIDINSLLKELNKKEIKKGLKKQKSSKKVIKIKKGLKNN